MTERRATPWRLTRKLVRADAKSISLNPFKYDQCQTFEWTDEGDRITWFRAVEVFPHNGKDGE